MKKYIVLFILLLIATSCARVGSPEGGIKDSIPPTFTGSNIDSTRINVPVDTKSLRLDFDEYITLKEVQKNLIISPPIKTKRILPSMLGNRYVLIEWEGDLQENTTYNFNFGNAIADLNESNILPYFNFAFSTGEKLDEMYISGVVTDAMKRPLDSLSFESPKDNNFVVGLYQEKDTIEYSQKPYYIAKADPDGYFELNYLSPGKYRILAYDDENQNMVYDIGKESVAFEKEPIDLTESISGKPIKLYPSRKPIRLVESKESTGGFTVLFEGNPDSVTIAATHEKLTDYKVTHRKKSDSAQVWFDAKELDLGVNQSENIRLAYNADGKTGESSLFYRLNPENELTLNNAKGNLIPPGTFFEILSNYPIESLNTQQWKLIEDSVNTIPLVAEISPLNNKKILIKSPLVKEKKYSLTIPRNSVTSYYISNEKAYQFNFEMDIPENYGTFVLTINNQPEKPFWIQFLDSSEKVVIERLTTAEVNEFASISPGKYSLRILVDNNENGFWDQADFLSLMPAEDVYVFPKEIEIRPLWENRESWNLVNNSTALELQQTVSTDSQIDEEVKQSSVVLESNSKIEK